MSRRNRRLQPKEELRELGFGSKLTDTSTRLINKDGTFNVIRTNNVLGRYYLDLYHRFITMSWPRFFLIFFAFFFGLNGLFASFYSLLGSEQFQGVSPSGGIGHYWDMYFFSTQTFTTVGYGHIAPVGWVASMIASVESVLGWLSFAIATGLLYGRFARPVSRILFSDNALLAPYKDKTGFMFRIANARSSQLIEVETEVILSLIDQGTNGQAPRRKYYNLKLEVKRINLLSLSWTIVHPITDDSPLYGISLEELKNTDAEFWVLMKAFDDTFSQVVYQRTSYTATDMLWGAKFKPMYSSVEGSSATVLELDKINDVERVSLPELILETEETSDL
jgi:inward rectifier potassium channel